MKGVHVKILKINQVVKVLVLMLVMLLAGCTVHSNVYDESRINTIKVNKNSNSKTAQMLARFYTSIGGYSEYNWNEVAIAYARIALEAGKLEGLSDRQIAILEWDLKYMLNKRN